MSAPFLFPPPRSVTWRGTPVPWPRRYSIAGHAPGSFAESELERGLAARSMTRAEPGLGSGTDVLRIELALGPVADPVDGAHRLELQADRARLTAAGGKGLQYACTTLARLLEHEPLLPPLVVEDAPDVARRGLSWDVSRCRIPNIDTLLDLVDLCARWKVDQLQLYVEHTFAYAGHEEVWRGCDPLTPVELRSLDAYADERHVELVPTQQSFGHLHRWLRLDRYRPLAECPEGVEHPFSPTREPFSLCPTDPRALELVAGLYDQLLAASTSQWLHVGLDETFDLGQGRSARACAERGVGAVYLDWLLAIHGLVSERGRRMQFWADVVENHPEVVPELPPDALPVFWGYDADHDFERRLALAADAPFELGIAPGTSAWLSVGGRTRNLLANQARAARAAREAGAVLYLTTEWGDRGHLQPWPVALAGVAAGAVAGWNADAAGPPSRDLVARALEADALEAPGSGLGALVLELGESGDPEGARALNSSVLGRLLVTGGPFPPPQVEGLTAAGLARTREGLGDLTRRLGEVRVGSSAGRTALRELSWASRVLSWSAGWGLSRFGAGDRSEDELAAELEGLAEEHAGLWGLRARPGGLPESLAWLRTAVREAAGRRAGTPG